MIEREDGAGFAESTPMVAEFPVRPEPWIDALGVDHEKTGASDRELGWDVCALADGIESQPVSNPALFCAPADCLPRTRRSKSSSLDSLVPFNPPTALKDMISSARLLRDSLAEFEDSSWSFRVCSCSTRFDKDLTRLMKVWNW